MGAVIHNLGVTDVVECPVVARTLPAVLLSDQLRSVCVQHVVGASVLAVFDGSGLLNGLQCGADTFEGRGQTFILRDFFIARVHILRGLNSLLVIQGQAVGSRLHAGSLNQLGSVLLHALDEAPVSAR